MEQRARDDLATGSAHALFPSLGFFGGDDVDALRVPLEGPVSRLLLRLPPGATGTLDLRGVQLVRDGEPVDQAGRVAHVRQSRHTGPESVGLDPFALEGIRTARDPGAWWVVRFAEPVEADELWVHNRRDRYGYRTRQLLAEVAAPGEDWGRSASVGLRDDADRLCGLVEELTGLDVRPDGLSESEAEERRAAVVRALADRARREPLTGDLDVVRRLLALVPTGHGNDRPRLTDDELTLLAHCLLVQLRGAERTRTSLPSFGFGLASLSDLERLREAATAVAPVFGLGAMVITRHGPRPSGFLHAASTQFLDLVDRAREDLAAIGMPLMLGYGTLLGAVRDGDFIAHDDDVDLLYPLEARSAEEARPLVDDLASRLGDRGWEIWENESRAALNFHLIDRESRLRLDLFPVLVDGDEVRLHMEHMRVRAIARHLVLPEREATFLGREVVVPHDPEGFLTERYGASWRVVDPYDDWPWPLDSEDSEDSDPSEEEATTGRVEASDG